MIVNQYLIDQLKNRDEIAFRKVYNEYYRLIYYIALSIVKNRETAEEIVQDTFLKMLDNIDTYSEKGRFKEWLTQIARNLSKNAVTRNKMKDVVLNNEIIIDAPDCNESEIETILTINDILDELSAQIVILKIIYNYRFKEIANDLDLSIGVTQGKYYDAIKKLKLSLQEEV